VRPKRSRALSTNVKQLSQQPKEEELNYPNLCMCHHVYTIYESRVCEAHIRVRQAIALNLREKSNGYIFTNLRLFSRLFPGEGI